VEITLNEQLTFSCVMACNTFVFMFTAYKSFTMCQNCLLFIIIHHIVGWILSFYSYIKCSCFSTLTLIVIWWCEWHLDHKKPVKGYEWRRKWWLARFCTWKLKVKMETDWWWNDGLNQLHLHFNDGLL